MRLLLLIMTGIGFTLGLLCGLLLHLPADGMPAHPHPILHIHDDLSGRAVQSVSDQQRVLMTADQKANSTAQGHLSRGSSDSRTALKSSFHPGSDTGRDPNSFVSSGRENNHGLQQATGQPVGLTRRTGQEKGEDVRGQENPHPPHPALAQPITSFTLRLRNTGGQFVVDSAVQRHVDDTGREVPAQDGNAPVLPPKQNLHEDETDFPQSQNVSLEDVVQGVLWSPRLEDSCPRGVPQHDVSSWRRKAAGMEVVRMEEGCGRMQNRLVTFKDGSKACARYRLNTDQMQGEVYSYYLAQLLHLHHLPPALLLPISPLSPQWRSVHLQMSLAQWADGRPVILTRWMDDLLPAHIPHELREDDRKLHPTGDILGKKTTPELCELLQWSDLIVFDYLTANLDRMVNNMFNKQWNPEMMHNAAHNLEKTQTGSLVFLDNESGLFHGYRLLEKYHGYHEALLRSLCVFRGSTAKAVKTLYESGGVGRELQSALELGEVHHRHLPPMPERNVDILRDRLAQVHEQIVRCEALYGR